MRIIDWWSNLGVSEDLDPETKMRAQILNMIWAVTALMAMAILVFGYVMEFPIDAKIEMFALISVIGIPFYLNLKGRHLAARISYLIISYCVISLIVLIFGLESNYQYYLVPGVGMVFLFVHEEIGAWKWVLSVIAIPIWALLEWVLPQTGPFLVLEPEVMTPLSYFNIVLVFLTIMAMLYTFTRQSTKQVHTIREQKRQFEELNRELEQFAYIVSHDLKAPLRGINSMITFIEEDYGEGFDEKLKEMFQLVKDRALRMDDLIHGILAYSRANTVEGEVKTFNLGDMVDEILDSLNESEQYQVDVPVELPVITSNYTQLNQVLSNLISNAFKYHDKKMGKVALDVDEMENGFMKLTVVDDGPGIEKKYHDKIFEVFHSGNAKKRTDSTGIGLAIVKKLVDKNGGNLGLDSEPGKGSAFWFTWPVSEPA